MGRDIKEFYNLRHRYLDKRKETNLNILKSTINKITCNNDVAVTNAPAHLRENKDECNKNAATRVHKVKAQRKTTGFMKNHESAEPSGRKKDRIKHKSEEEGSDKIGKISKMVKIAKIDKGDKRGLNDAKRANKGPEGPSNHKTYHKGKKCQLHKSEKYKKHDAGCNDQHTGECEIIKNTNETDTCTDFYVENSNNPSAYHHNDNKLSSHWGSTSNKAHVHPVEEEKNNNLKTSNVNNCQMKNVYDVLDKNFGFISCTINSNVANTRGDTSSITQSNYRRKHKQQNYSHATSNICDNRNYHENVAHATISCDSVNANLNVKNDDHAKGGNSYYNEKCDYDVVKNIFEGGPQMNKGYHNSKSPFTDGNHLSVMENTHAFGDYNVINKRIHIKEKKNVLNIYKVFFPKDCPVNLVISKKNMDKNYHHPAFLNKKIIELTDTYTHCAEMTHHGTNDTRDKPMDSKLQMYKSIYRYYCDRGQISNSQNVKGIITCEDSGEQNSNHVSVNTSEKNHTNRTQEFFDDEHKSNVALTKCLSSKNSEKGEKSRGTSNSGSEDHNTNYRTHNGNDAGDAYSSSHNSGNNDSYYGHNCNRSNNAKNGSDDDDSNGSDDDKNGRDDNKNGRDHDKNASDDDKNDSDDEKNESEDDRNESDRDHNQFDLKGRPHRDSSRISHKDVNPDYREQQIEKSKFYSKEAQHGELSNLHEEMLTKHINSSGDLLKELHMQKNEKEKSPNNKYVEENSYVRSDDITLPINHFLKKKKTCNWNIEHYEMLHSLNDIICEVKKESSSFINNYKNQEMVIDNNNSTLKSKIDTTLFSSINKNGNFSNGIHLPTYADSNMRKKYNAKYVNNNMHQHKLGNKSELNIKHTSHLGPRNSNDHDPEMEGSSGYGCNSYRSNQIDHIHDNRAKCSEYDCDKQPFRNNRSPIRCRRISNFKRYNMRTENIHVEISTNKPTLQCDENFKTARTDPFKYNSQFLHKNKLKGNSYSKQVLLKNVGHKVDSEFVQIRKKENMSTHTDPFNDHAKTEEICVEENPNGKNSLINKDIYNNFKGTETSNAVPYAKHNEGSNTPFDSSMNSYFYLKNELHELDDIHTSISNDIKANGQWSQRRNLPTSLPTKAVESPQKDTPYSNTPSNAHQPLSHHHEVSKVSRNNTEKKMNREMVTKGYLDRNHNFRQYNQYADNYIVLEDSVEDVTYETEDANEEMGANRSSTTNITKNVNPFLTKCYNEQNDYEYIEDDSSVYIVNNHQPDQKVPYPIINPGQATSDKMNGVDCAPARTLNGGDFLNTKDAHGFFPNRENNSGICTVEDDDVIEVIPSEVKVTNASLASDNYSQQSGGPSCNEGDKGSHCERGNCDGKKKHTNSAELPNSRKTLGSNYLTRSKSSHVIQHNYSDHSIDSIYDRRGSGLYEYDSVMGRKKLRKHGRQKITQKATEKKRKIRSLNDIAMNYSVEGPKLARGKRRKRGFTFRKNNMNITAISNGSDKTSEGTNMNRSNHDICNPNRDIFNYENMEDDPFDMTNEEIHHSEICSGDINYEQSNINPYRQRIGAADYNGTIIASADMKGSNLSSIDYYRNYDSVQCVKEDLLKNEKFPFIFYDSNIRNLVIYYKDDCSDEIKCKYFSAQRFGHATAKKIALNFLRSLGINPDHLENNKVFSYEKDSKSKLFNMERGKTYVDKEQNSNINLIYDMKKRNVVVSWINKVKGYSFRKFSTQRFGFDVALCLSIDFYKNLGGEKEEEEIRNYINKVNSNFKSIRILTNKRKKRNLKGKIIDSRTEFMELNSNSYENMYDNTSLSYIYFSNIKYNIENLKNKSMQKGTSANTQMNKYVNLFYITDQFYEIFECKLKNIHLEQVKMTKVYQYDFFLNKTFYFLYLKYLENVKLALCDENVHNFATMCQQIKSCKSWTVQSYHNVQSARDDQYASDSPINYFQLVDFYCDSDILMNCTNGNINYFISKMDYYRDEDILIKGYYTADDTKLYDMFFLSSGRKGGLEEDTFLADLNSKTYNDIVYHERIYNNRLYKNGNHHSELYPGGLIHAKKTNRRTTINKSAERGKSFQDYHVYYKSGNKFGSSNANPNDDGNNCNCRSNNFRYMNSNSSGRKYKNSYSHFDNTDDDDDVWVSNETRKGTRKRRRMCKHRKRSKTKGKEDHDTISKRNSIMSTKKSESFYEDQNEQEMLPNQASSYKQVSKAANKMRNISTGRGKNKDVHRGASKKTARGTNKRMHKRTLKNARKGVTKGGTRGINRGNHTGRHNMNYLKNKKFSSTNKNISNLLTKGRKYILCYNYMGKIQVKVFRADIYGSMTAQKKSVAFLQQVRRDLKSEGKILYSESDSKTAYDITTSLMESALLNPYYQDGTALNNNIQCADHPSHENNTVVKQTRRRKRKKGEDALEEVSEMAVALQAEHLEWKTHFAQEETKQEDAEQQTYQPSQRGAQKCSRGRTIIGRSKENELISQLNAQLSSQMNTRMNAQISDEHAPANNYQKRKLRNSSDYQNIHSFYESQDNNEDVSMFRIQNCEDDMGNPNDPIIISESSMKSYSSNEELHSALDTQNKEYNTKDEEYEKGIFAEPVKKNSNGSDTPLNEYINNTTREEGKHFDHNKRMNSLKKAASISCTNRYSDATEYEISIALSNKREHLNSTIRSNSEDEKGKDFSQINKNEHLSLLLGKDETQDSSNVAITKHINLSSHKRIAIEDVQKGKINTFNCFNKLSSEQKVVKGYLTLRKEKTITPNVKRVYALYDLYNKIINECDYADFLSQNSSRNILKNRKADPNYGPGSDPNDDLIREEGDDPNDNPLDDFSPYNKRIIMKSGKTVRTNRNRMPRIRRNQDGLANKEVVNKSECRDAVTFPKEREAKEERGTATGSDPREDAEMKNFLKSGETLSSSNSACSPRNFKNDWSGLVKYNTAKGVVKIPKICIHKLARKKGFSKLTCIIYRGKGEFVSYFLERSNKKINNRNMVQNENKKDKITEPNMPFKVNEKNDCAKLNTYRCSTGANAAKEQPTQSNKKYYLREKQSNLLSGNALF
ncbi:hypothetical protein C922_04312 [Plasmodium inui San Antonio 1]|uniref:Uncharacterized protein n=1 Tax=Plasmodium inui San Antonio 1 TaxID=1237626 RepID=W7A896_9APIC|nr:hypothetical protein C922_04312 [Plasmodium inui San Antonio 1]EUD65369.1 hypothetical protein C922_04312 [Plasmodium inui San Antonio 1]